jgi:prolyl-tRNA synthetase
VQSYRDLPLLINQWANVVRWEMRTRLFLRTAEFLWQEGHTAHATREEAEDETMKMLRVYAEFAEEWMAMPVIQGRKTESERFPGAVDTYCIEAMMQDRKALQAGTSHFLGQNFAKASEIQFLDADGQQKFAWTTSWGVSTRLIGAMIMTHSDDDGLAVPPRLAPTHVVILPVMHKPETAAAVLEHCHTLAADLRSRTFAGRPIEVEVDARDLRGGDKMWQWVKKGVPVRVEVGPRDIEQGSVFVGRRDRTAKDKQSMARDAFVDGAASLLQEIQDGMFARAKAYREEHTKRIDSKPEFEAFFTPTRAGDENAPSEIHGGFALSHFCGDPAVEADVKNRMGVTIRCIPLDAPEEQGTCVITGRPSARRVVWGKSY